jgi:hypothetical protein
MLLGVETNRRCTSCCERGTTLLNCWGRCDLIRRFETRTSVLARRDRVFVGDAVANEYRLASFDVRRGTRYFGHDDRS